MGEPWIYSFGPFRLDARDRTLRRESGEIVPLTPKVADLLVVLVESAGQVISKDTLVDKLWPGTFVEAGNLPFQIHQLRQALGDQANDPKYVDTVPRRGYRFIAKVESLEAPAELLASPLLPVAPAADHTDAARSRRVQPRAVIRPLLIATSLIIVLAMGVAWRANPHLPRVTRIQQLTHDGLRKEWLRPLSRDQLLVASGRDDHIVRLDDEAIEHPESLKSFAMLDVSPLRAEIVGTRRNDPGGDLGLWIVPLAAGSAQRLGMIRVRNSAAWSHDGRFVAYAFDNTLSVTSRNGDFMRTLVTLADDVREMQWSPDDRRIRFTRFSRSDRTVESTLAEINADGSGDLREVLPRGGYENPHGGFWFPNGEEFVFVAGPEWRHRIYLRREPSAWLPDRGRTSAVELSTPALDWESAVPSLDGARIFALGVSPPQLVAYNTAGRFEPYLGGIAAFAVEFSRDQQAVAYVSFPDRRLMRAHADGNDARQLTPNDWIASSPAWSPDNKHLAFRAKAPGAHAKIYVLPSDGGQPEPIEQRDIEQGAPTWSPDGRRLAFGDVPETFAHPTGTEAIHVYDLLLKRQSDLPGSRGLWTSRWSPDGRYMAALTIQGQSLVLFDFKTSRWRTMGVEHVSDPRWSADSQYIYCFPEWEERRIARVHVPDGAVDSVIDLRNVKIQVYGAGLALHGAPLVLRNPVDVYALELAR